MHEGEFSAQVQVAEGGQSGRQERAANAKAQKEKDVSELAETKRIKRDLGNKSGEGCRWWKHCQQSHIHESDKIPSISYHEEVK